MDETNNRPKHWDRLADEVKNRRDHLGLTQPELSAACGGSPSATIISRIEGAKQSDYKPQILIRLERALGWESGSVNRVLAGGSPTLKAETGGAAAPIDLDAYVGQTPMEQVLLEVLRSDRAAYQRAAEGLQRQLRELNDKVDRLAPPMPTDDKGNPERDRQIGA
jgi:transcriptional regulator with XRE-family HTH domain